MVVSEITTLRGREAWHTTFRVSGGTFFYKLDDRYESWFDTRTFASLRHVQDVDQGSYERTRTFEIFPDRQVYTENESEERESVPEPLDDGIFSSDTVPVPMLANPLTAGEAFVLAGQLLADNTGLSSKYGLSGGAFDGSNVSFIDTGGTSDWLVPYLRGAEVTGSFRTRKDGPR